MSSNPETSNHYSSSSLIEEDIPPYPWGLEGADFEQALEKRWDAQDRQWNAHVPVPAERDLVSPFIVTSDETLQRMKMKIHPFFLLPHQRDPNQGHRREIHLFQHHKM